MSSGELFAIAATCLLVASFSILAFKIFPSRNSLRITSYALICCTSILFIIGLCLRWIHYTKEMNISWIQAFPVVTLYETVVFSALIVSIIVLLVKKVRSYPLLTFVLTFLSAITVLGFTTLSIRTEPSLFLPSLKSYWLMAHVTLSFIAYVMFGVAAAIAVAVLWKGDDENLVSLLKKFLLFGTIIFTIGGIIFGALWAQEAWGRFWAWDPKETSAFITWIVYGIALHAVYLRNISNRAIALIALAGFCTVLFSYFAVNWYFIGLHSYVSM